MSNLKTKNKEILLGVLNIENPNKKISIMYESDNDAMVITLYGPNGRSRHFDFRNKKAHEVTAMYREIRKELY